MFSYNRNHYDKLLKVRLAECIDTNNAAIVAVPLEPVRGLVAYLLHDIIKRTGSQKRTSQSGSRRDKREILTGENPWRKQASLKMGAKRIADAKINFDRRITTGA
eukprot:COSAG01_NODE_976_length_12364_cov_109.353200_5_plen_105_part_00